VALLASKLQALNASTQAQCAWRARCDVTRAAIDAYTRVMMLLFIGTHSVTTTLNVHSRGRSFVGAIDLRGLAPSVRLFRRPNTNGMKK